MEENMNIFDFICEPYKLPKDKHIRLIELFAGYGSQALSLRYLGVPFEHHFVCEFDKYAMQTYNEIHNTSFETTDVKNVTAKDLNIVDTDKYTYILTYSFPCTDLSLAGTRAGMDKGSGTRSGLLWEVERLLRECVELAPKDDPLSTLPKILLLENVPQVITANGWREWNLFLEGLGYSNYCQVLNAKEVGYPNPIPQNRDRAFMVSILKGKDGTEYNYNFPHKKKLGLRLKDVLEDKVDRKYYLSDKMIDYISADNEKWTGNNEKALINKSVASTINTGEGSRRCDASNYIAPNMLDKEDVDIKSLPLTQKRLFGLFDSEKGKHQAGSVWDKNELAPTLDTMQGGYRQPMVIANEPYVVGGIGEKKSNSGTQWYLQDRIYSGKSVSTTVTTSFNPYYLIIDDTQGFEDGEARFYKDYAPTLRSSRSGLKAMTPYCIRKLTPKECFRLMGVKDEDTDKISCSDTQKYKQAGNSIVVNVLMAIFKEML